MFNITQESACYITWLFFLQMKRALVPSRTVSYFQTKGITMQVKDEILKSLSEDRRKRSELNGIQKLKKKKMFVIGAQLV